MCRAGPQLLAAIGLLLLPSQLSAQGEIDFRNGTGAAVINALTGQPVVQGDLFHAGLYYAPNGTTDEAQFVQTGSSTRFAIPGVFAGGLRTVPTSTPGWFVMLQVRVWEMAYGSTYEEALSAPPQNGRLALTGKSNIFRYDTCYSPLPTVICDPAPLHGVGGMQGFVLVVPEPTVSLLLVAGTFVIGLSKFRIHRSRRSLQ